MSATVVADVERHTPASKRDLVIVFWIFPIFFALFGVIFVLLARVIPPPRPDVTTDQKVQWFAAHATTIQIGFAAVCVVFGGAAIANGYVAYQMKRMSSGPTFAYAYMGSMAVGTLPGLMLVALCFLAATFRPGRAAAHRRIALRPRDAVLQWIFGLLCHRVPGVRGRDPLRQERHLSQMACLRVDLANRHRGHRHADVGVLSRSVFLERVDRLLVGRHRFRLLAELPGHLSEIGHRPATRRVPAPGLTGDPR